MLIGVIDKLLITEDVDGSLAAEIIDFKTNRIRVDVPAVARAAPLEKRSKQAQFAFDFESEPEPPPVDFETNNIIEITARDYELQMQAYAHAVRELIPSIKRVRVTLHFLQPNVEVHLSDELLDPVRCEQAIDSAMMRIVTSADPVQFPVKTAPHCRMCNFLRICNAGKEYLR